MKIQVQEIGVRKWFGSDFLTIQDELLYGLEGFFSQYGNCIIQGCNISGTNISQGIVGLSGFDIDGNSVYKLAKFSGLTNVLSWPVYLTLSSNTYTRDYRSGETLNVAIDYYASCSYSANQPYIQIYQTGNTNTFNDNFFKLKTPNLTSNTIYVNQIYSAGTNLNTILNNISGGTVNVSGKADLSGATFTGAINAPNILSAGTNLNNIFASTAHTQNINTINGLQGQLDSKGNLSGSYFTSLSATTFYSGSTNLSQILASMSTPGNKADLSGATFTGAINAPNILSAGTNLNNIFISTGGSININFVNNLQSELNSKSNLSGANFSGVIQSGGTDLGNLFASTSHTQNISSINGLQNQLDSKGSLLGANFITLSANTLYSGDTNLQTIIDSKVGKPTQLVPGNIYTVDSNGNLVNTGYIASQQADQSFAIAMAVAL